MTAVKAIRDRLDTAQQSSTHITQLKQQQKELTSAVGLDVGDTEGCKIDDA